MIKFFLGVAIVAFTTFCGYLLSKKYRKRKLFYRQFYDFNEKFLTEITYYRRPIMDFLQENAYKLEFGFLLEEYVRSIRENRSILYNLLENPAFSFLKKEEKETAEAYFQMLGKGDSISQKNYFSAVKETLSLQRKSAEDEAKKYGDLYVKIGFLFGLFVLILIV